MDNKATVQKFRLLIETTFSQKPEKTNRANQIDFDHEYYEKKLFSDEYDKVLKIIVSVRDQDTLSELMDTYLQLFFQYYSNKNLIHYYWSDQTFRELIEQSPGVTIKTHDLFDEWSRIIRDISKIYSSNNLKKRYNELSKFTQSAVDSFIKGEKKKKSIIDVLKAEFTKQKAVNLKSMDQLYDFDPYLSDTLRETFDSQFENVKKYWTNATIDDKAEREYWLIAESGLDPWGDEFKRAWAENSQALTKEQADEFFKALDEFSKYLATVSDEGTLQLFQIIKYLQDFMRTNREPMKDVKQTKLVAGDQSELIYELYWMACLELMIHAAKKLLLVNTRSRITGYRFTDDEIDYFMNPIKANKYLYGSDIEYRFRADPNIIVLCGLSKLFLIMILLTKKQLSFAALATLKQMIDIQSQWNDIRELTDKMNMAKNEGAAALGKIFLDPENRRILINFLRISMSRVDLTQRDSPILSQDILKIGNVLESAGSKIKIVYIDPKPPYNAYVEFECLKPILFIINKDYLKNKIFASHIYEIYKSLSFMEKSIHVLFEYLPLVPVAIEFGLGEAIEQYILMWYVNKWTDAVSEIFPELKKELEIVGLIVTGVAAASAGAGLVKPGLREPNIPLEEDLHVVTIDFVEETRSLAEINASSEQNAKLMEDLTQSKIKAPVSKMVEKMSDFKIQSEQIAIDISEILGQAVEKYLPKPPQLATNEGLIFREADRGIQSKSTEVGSRSVSRKDNRLVESVKKSKDFKELEHNYQYLIDEDRNFAEGSVKTIFDNLNRSTTTPSKAAKKIKTLLRDVKEKRGELMTENTITSTYEILEPYDIPRRGKKEKGPPILDRVYKVKNYTTKQIYHIVVESKGGPNTSLGYVNKQEITIKNGRFEKKYVDGKVRQATGEWYWYKIVEVYETGNKALAKTLLEAARNGKLESYIIKTTKEMDPKITQNTLEVSSFLKGKNLP